MRPTRPWVLVVVAVVAGLGGWSALRAAYGSLPELPGSWPTTVGIAAVFVAGLAWSTRNRLARRHGATPPEPLLVARFAALARACSPVGAGLAGGWFGALLFLLTQRGGLDAVTHDRGIAVGGVLSGLALAAAGLWLEWVCRVRSDDAEEQETLQRRRSS